MDVFRARPQLTTAASGVVPAHDRARPRPRTNAGCESLRHVTGPVLLTWACYFRGARAGQRRGRYMQRDIFTSDHEAFRDTVRSFIAKDVASYHEQWERDGVVSRDVWLAAGRAGLLGIDMDEKYGGGGEPDFRYYAIMDEEVGRAGATGLGFFVHNDMIGRYLDRLCTPEQRERWLPGYCSGELITAIAMTEPAAGSDLQGIRTTAVKDGDCYVLNGQKTFISNGQLCDLVIVVARTDPAAGHKGMSLLVVESG